MEARPGKIVEQQIDQLCVNTIRTLAMDAVQKANSGHPGAPMEMAPMAYVLWTQFMKYNPANPDWPNRDRFILSAGHACMLLYALLHLTGYDLPLEEIKNFRQWGSKTPGHPEYGHTVGVETSTGPLGQGFSNGVGMAIAERALAARFNRPGHEIVDYKIYSIVSDGDLMEGVTSECASIAGHLRLSNLIYLYSDNRISIEGHTRLAFTEDVGARFLAYGWYVQRVEGTNLAEIAEAIGNAQRETNRPSLIVVRNHIGFGSPNKQDSASAHGEPLGEEEVKLTKHVYGWPTEPAFYIPDEALAHFRQQVDKGKAAEAEWNARFAAWATVDPNLAAEWDRAMKGELPEGWDTDIPDFADLKPIATRDASHKIINAVAARYPLLIGGSADLAPSTKTYMNGLGDFLADNYAGRNLHFGVREHAMGAIINGVALSRMLKPFGAGFLIFSDYLRPTIRLAALMNIAPIFVFTHDSVGLGEDGPTHQPIEHLCSLRAIPNTLVIRPADATETAEAWRLAIERHEGPTILVLTRQKLPVIDRKKFAAVENLRKGGYILADSGNGKPDIILMSTGSEVQLALGARERLAAEGINARVVSMPCWELYAAQPKEYRDAVLLPEVRARLAIEAAWFFGWNRYVGGKGDAITMTRFGASGPGDVLLEKFGFTIDNVVEKAKSVIARQ